MMFKRFLSKTGRKEPGMILPLALILLVAATLIVIPGLGFMYSLLSINTTAQQDQAGYYAADAGISAVYWYWMKDSTNAPNYPTIPNVNGMTVQITQLAHNWPADHSYDNYTIQSVALQGSKPRATVVAFFQVPAPGNNIFNQAATSLNGTITMSGGAKVISDGKIPGNNGNIYADGNIKVDPSASVAGVATATGTLTVDTGGGAHVGAGSSGGAAPISYTVDVQSFINQATGPGSTHYASNPVPGYGTFTFPGPANITGDLTIGGSVTVHLKGTTYCTGNLHIGNSGIVDGAYTIVCGGTLTIDGSANANLAAGNIPFIICQGTTVTVGGSGQTAAVIYAPNAAATISGSGYIYGALIAKKIDIVGSGTIKYLSGIHSETQIPGAGLGGAATLIGYNYR
jgi:hypothetical protein